MIVYSIVENNCFVFTLWSYDAILLIWDLTYYKPLRLMQNRKSITKHKSKFRAHVLVDKPSNEKDRKHRSKIDLSFTILHMTKSTQTQTDTQLYLSTKHNSRQRLASFLDGVSWTYIFIRTLKLLHNTYRVYIAGIYIYIYISVSL